MASSHHLQPQVSKKTNDKIRATVLYHDFFSYPLNRTDVDRWSLGDKGGVLKKGVNIVEKDGWFFVEGREDLVARRLAREKIARAKRVKAQKAANFLKRLPSIRFIGITGSLAMSNTSKKSDIDLILITSSETLWITRLIVLLSLQLFGFAIRHSGQKEERDRLCLNMWLDEQCIEWSIHERNIYTAHEIVQILPLVNKDKIYEKFLYTNNWVLDYWPKAVDIRKIEIKINRHKNSFQKAIMKGMNIFFFFVQYLYMRKKITTEFVSQHIALFHPVNWSKKVEKYLS